MRGTGRSGPHLLLDDGFPPLFFIDRSSVLFSTEVHRVSAARCRRLRVSPSGSPEGAPARRGEGTGLCNRIFWISTGPAEWLIDGHPRLLFPLLLIGGRNLAGACSGSLNYYHLSRKHVS